MCFLSDVWAVVRSSRSAFCPVTVRLKPGSKTTGYTDTRFHKPTLDDFGTPHWMNLLSGTWLVQQLFCQHRSCRSWRDAPSNVDCGWKKDPSIREMCIIILIGLCFLTNTTVYTPLHELLPCRTEGGADEAHWRPSKLAQLTALFLARAVVLNTGPRGSEAKVAKMEGSTT